jgi:hypothetical protein
VEIFHTLTAPILLLCPIAAILVPAALTWLKDLSASARRMRRLEELSKVVAFWDGWIKTASTTKALDPWSERPAERRIEVLVHEGRVQLANAGHDALELYLKDEMQDLKEFRLTFKQFQAYRRGLPWHRALLLLYKSPNRPAKYYRRMFHVSLALPWLMWAIEVPILIHLQKPKPSVFSAHVDTLVNKLALTHPVLFGLFLLVAVVSLVGFVIASAFPFWWLARKRENAKNLYPMEWHRRRLREIRPADTTTGS